jgi:hypothetical protein
MPFWRNRIHTPAIVKPGRYGLVRNSYIHSAANGGIRIAQHHILNVFDPCFAEPVIVVDETHIFKYRLCQAAMTGMGQAELGLIHNTIQIFQTVRPTLPSYVDSLIRGSIVDDNDLPLSDPDLLCSQVR